MNKKGSFFSVISHKQTVCEVFLAKKIIASNKKKMFFFILFVKPEKRKKKIEKLFFFALICHLVYHRWVVYY